MVCLHFQYGWGSIDEFKLICGTFSQYLNVIEDQSESVKFSHPRHRLGSAIGR